MDETYQASMASGPRLLSFRHNIYFFGAYQNITLGEEERGKKLQVEVDTGNRPLCWIELWPGTYDGADWVKWTTDRGQEAVIRSGGRPQPNPSLLWTIEPGNYTLYFVSSSTTKKASDDIITYRIRTV
jgi:hypothetical protein